ncbi:IS630 family transposase [Candidatus Bealeia paramacronuclearis]|uniref:IS630 family transposase n=1 Tax=Candidatus Bealeia paramacronuclearis TaxID=1921001 RepID=A0ABZ2C3S2_9PROT|nr:IS630 family transposase [Candidatus Bealeia paramacronuclearis]MEB3702439.1 IS630 family transposase [Candidatus Bealeia paramacronuclearis]MEB3703014.1 IS630 family transposase [Candidatus Bealeia paramacronuclearis]
MYKQGMKIELTIKEKQELEFQRSKERERRVADCIKAVMLNAEGWTQMQIAQALRIRYETVQDHLNDYKNSRKLKPENGGSESHLTSHQTFQLISHFEDKIHLKAELICAYVDYTFGVHFTVSGMNKWLIRNNFSFKKPKETPFKADAVQFRNQECYHCSP